MFASKAPRMCLPSKPPRGVMSARKSAAPERSPEFIHKLKLAKLRRKKNKRSPMNLGKYIYKVLKMIHPDVQISKKSVQILDDFLHNIAEKLADEASHLCKITKRETMNSRQIQAAVRLVAGRTGDVHKHMICEGVKAIFKYVHYGE